MCAVTNFKEIYTHTVNTDQVRLDIEDWGVVLPHHLSILCFPNEKYSKDYVIVYSSYTNLE